LIEISFPFSLPCLKPFGFPFWFSPSALASFFKRWRSARNFALSSGLIAPFARAA
jgi:hypothetical protein